MKTGVYCWLNKRNGKRYVGSASASLKGRKEFYIASLRGGYCHNHHLQAAWNKYGEASFKWVVLETCEPKKCVKREQYWMDYYRSWDRRYGYNHSPTAGSTLGLKQTKRARRNMRAAMQRIKHEISARMVGNCNGNPGVKRGPRPDWVVRKLRRAAKKQWSDPQARREMSQIKKHQYAERPELREVFSKLQLGVKQTPETIAKRVLKLRGQRRTPEARAKMSESARRREARKREERMQLLSTGN